MRSPSSRRRRRDAIAWADFQELRERLSCRRTFTKKRDELRREIVEKPTRTCGRSHRAQGPVPLVHGRRDFAELRESFRDAERRVSPGARRCRGRGEAPGRAEERRLLAQALSQTATKELAHRKAEIPPPPRPVVHPDRLWEQARINLEEIPADRARARRSSSWRPRSCGRGRSRRRSRSSHAASCPTSSTGRAVGGGGGLAFAPAGSREGLPLLDLALNSLNVEIPFAREELQSKLRATLKSVLGSPTRPRPHPSGRPGSPSTSSGRGAAIPSSARARKPLREGASLGQGRPYLPRPRNGAPRSTRYARAVARSPGRLLAARRGIDLGVSPGGRRAIRRDRRAGPRGRKFAVELRAGSARESVVWEKRAGGTSVPLFRQDLARCHFLPVGVVDPSEGARSPSRVRYQRPAVKAPDLVRRDGDDRRGRLSTASCPRSRRRGASTRSGISSPRTSGSRRRVLGEERSLSRTLVSFRSGTAPRRPPGN